MGKAGTVRRVLFLADRNILIDQSITNDFKPFGSVMTKVATARSTSRIKSIWRSIRR